MPMRCPDCREHFTEAWEALQHDCDASTPGVKDDPAPDGGLSIDGRMQLRVTFTSGGVQFTSEPLDHERATAYANNISDATISVDGQQRPLCDDERTILEPVEVDDSE